MSWVEAIQLYRRGKMGFTLLEYYFPPLVIPPYCWTTLVNCSRVVLGVYFPTDILVSAVLGVGTALFSLEQISNAAALQQLGYGHTMNEMDSSVIEHWLDDNHAIHITYPNIAKVLVQWIQDGMPEMGTDFIETIWDSVNVLHIKHQ